MSTNSKYFLSSMASVPALSGTAGALMDVLDACLVNGFGSVTLDSLVISSGVATATYSVGHGFLDHTVVLIEGATPSAANGEKRITVSSANVFTFDATGITDQTATGTITAKMAPLGWTKAYSGTNKAAYSRSALGATAMLLRVDDTAAQTARVVGYESMTDVDTGSGPFPTAAQISGGLYWHKSSTANSTARNWAIVGDGKTLHLFLGFNASAPTTLEYCAFGDLQTYKAGDAYHCCLMGNISASISTTGSTNNASTQVNNIGTAGCYLARTYAQTGGSISFLRHALAGDVMGRAGITAPNPVDDGIHLTPIYANETTAIARGLLRGIYSPRNDCDGAYATGDLSVIISGNPYLAVIPGSNTATGGQCWFDLQDWP
jgi:hypothetical protein